MAQATTPGHSKLPCSPKQALTLYRLLFQRPADLGQLQNALKQVHEDWDCPPGLELPMILLKMEESQRAQEKLFWDLELLTGIGLGLFWPPWARFCSQRGQTQHVWSQYSQSWGRSVDGDFEQLSSKLCPLPQAGEAHSESHQLLKGPPSVPPPASISWYPLGAGIRGGSLDSEVGSLKGLGRLAEPVYAASLRQLLNSCRRLATDSSSTSDLDEARSDGDPRLEGPVIPAKAAPGTPTGEWETASRAGASGAGCLHPSSSSSFKEPGNSELKDPGKMEEPNIQSSCEQTLRSTQEGKLGQEAPEPSGLASQVLSALQDPSKGLGSGLSQERAEPQTLLTNSPQGYSEETPQGQRGQSPQGYKRESIQGQDKGVPQSQNERKQAQQGQELETPRFGEGSNSEVWGKVQGEATVWCQEEGNPQGHSNDFCKFPGKLIPQHMGKRIARPPGSSTQVTQVAATQEGMWAPLPAAPPTPPQLQGPEGGILASEAQEQQPRLSSALGEQRGPRDPKPSKAIWPAPGSREEALASSGQEVLQRLLELNSAARQRRRRDREQQRLRVLERLRIVANHHRRVHPLGFPPSVAQKAPQEDVAGRRQQRILRELLEQVHRGRALQLRALGARNTQNFQELLSPGTEKPTPGE